MTQTRIAKWQLLQRQALPLEIKVRMSQQRIRHWYNLHGGEVYVSYSGGKDSTVVLHLTRELHPEVPAVFVSTGLQYPEIRKQVKETPNVTWLRPTMPFVKVIETYGYPVVSKMVARFISDLQNASDSNQATCRLRLTGINKADQYCPTMRIPNKWRFLINAPFKISAKCCDVMKKTPFLKYLKETNRNPITGVMASDSRNREQMYLRHGCFMLNTKHPRCNPIGFWTDQDVLSYLAQFKVPYASVYGDIIASGQRLVTSGVARTGCVFCAFGAHLERQPNRFQQLAVSHPRLYEYCMTTLNMAEVLDYVGVEYQPSRQMELWKRHDL